jgi:N-acyl-D-amino-acid deacylase
MHSLRSAVPATSRSPTSLPNKRYERHTIEELAKDEKIDPIDMFIRIIREGNAANDDALIVAKSMTEADIELFYKQPWVMVASDGGIDLRHPRGAGTFPRVLGASCARSTGSRCTRRFAR